MKFVCISDTHNQHDLVEIPAGDVLLFAGDCTLRGSLKEVQSFLEWFSKQAFKYKIMIAGNHDYYFENVMKDDTYSPRYHSIKSLVPKDIIYLNDSGVEIEGIKIWGSPVQPWFYDWAFNKQRGEEIKKHWDLIPNNTDILVTHGPCHGFLDRTADNNQVGCEDLLEKILKVKPKYHVCGHIHEAYGAETYENINFINASILDADYKIANKPIEFFLNKKVILE